MSSSENVRHRRCRRRMYHRERDARDIDKMRKGAKENLITRKTCCGVDFAATRLLFAATNIFYYYKIYKDIIKNRKSLAASSFGVDHNLFAATSNFLAGKITRTFFGKTKIF